MLHSVLVVISNHVACAGCDNIQCPSDQYRSGSCSGTNNGLLCKGALRLVRASVTCICATSAPLIASAACCVAACSEKTCPDGQYLRGCGLLSLSGACVACDNTKCPVGQYRSGSCSGTNNGYHCSGLCILCTYECELVSVSVPILHMHDNSDHD